MKWLRTRIQRWKRRHEETTDEQAERPQQADSPGPRLILLVHDASGPASYRLHTFADAQSAEGFVDSWFPTGFEHGILAFWAVDDEPASPTTSDTTSDEEVVVLIQDADRREIVYPFSLPDMGLAHAWIKKEATRGLDLRLMQVYRAVPVRICRDDRGRVRLTPREPRPSRQPETASALSEAEAQRRLLQTKESASEAEAGEPDEAPRAKAQASGNGREASTIDEVLEEINAAELVDEVERVIRNKRWKQQDGPFRGFGSPRGKF